MVKKHKMKNYERPVFPGNIYLSLIIIMLLLAMSAMIEAVQGQDFISVTALQQLSVSTDTGEKPQSKVWTNGGCWWMVMPNSTGTKLWRLDGTTWTSVLELSSSINSHADVKAVGNITHILLFEGASSELVSIEYVPVAYTYQLWTARSTNVPITLDSGVETATIEIDSSGRMWLASDATSDINVRWSDSPYSIWSAPITLGSGTNGDDISDVLAFDGKIGVLWSNQNTERFGFRTHVDGTDPLTWTSDEVPASQSALNIGAGMADDHMHMVAATDGTIYAAVKTSYDTDGYPKIALLVRRPAGTWDDLYPIDESGTRPISLLSEANGTLIIVYTASEGNNNIVYKQSYISPISFGPRHTLISGAHNNAMSTKQIYMDEVVIIAGDGNSLAGVIANTNFSPGDSFAAHWAMDEGGGAVLVDSSINNNDADLAGSPTWVAGIRNLALNLDGTQYASAANSATLDLTGPMSIAAWIRPNSYATQRIVSKLSGSAGYEFFLGANSPYPISFRFNNNASYRLNSKTAYPINGDWMHVAATWDGTTMSLYVNGILDTTKVVSMAPASNTANAVIGANNSGSDKFSGSLDDIRIYRRALAAEEVLELAAGLAGSHIIRASAGPNGTIIPSGAVSVPDDSSQLFAITPNEGYHIADVLVDSGSVGAVTSYTFTNVTADHSISASFAINQYTITASAGEHGSITPSGEVSVDYGSDQAFVLTPDEGYHVADVLVDGESVGAVASYAFVNVVAGHTISAAFAIDVFTITASAGANGSIDPSDAVSVDYGADQSFTITPDVGYHIADVLVDGNSVGTGTSYMFTNVTADHNISASFAIDQYTITANAGEHGSITPSGEVSVDYGFAQAFAITPDEGYHVVDVLVDGESIGAVTSYTFENVTANHSIEVSFAIDIFAIAASAGPNGSVSPSGDVIVEYGSDRTFVIIPETDYEVNDVLIDGISIGPMMEYTFNYVTDDHTLYASFALILQAPVITSQPVLSATTGQPYSYDVDATGVPVPTYSLAIFPMGMTIDRNSGLIQWLPVAAGDVDIRVVAANEAGMDFQEFTIQVAGYSYLPGDANMANAAWPPAVIGSDVTYLVNYFRGMITNSGCFLDGFYASADVNASCTVIGSDVTRLVSYFRGHGTIDCCPDYPPAWLTSDDCPAEMPVGWPGCDEPALDGRAIHEGNIVK